MVINTNIEVAAEVLSASLLKWADRSAFSIGMGSDRLHAYMRDTRQAWRGPTPDYSNRVPIEWHWGVGPVKAGLNDGS